MPAAKMHAGELEITEPLVRQLLAAQFPQWANLALTPVPSAGTDNALFRLGEKMVVRLPRIHWASGQPAKEHAWLPYLAPHLPLAIPQPLALGEPSDAYPWQWAIHGWRAGEDATRARMSDPRQAAIDLAHFVAALQRIAVPAGLTPEMLPGGRGEPLTARDARVRAAIAALHGRLDTSAALAVWEAALAAPPWPGRPVWLHGDLQAGNLLAVQGRLSAVIDFGCLGLGDPACDVMAAWLHLERETRDLFRAVLQVDDATWLRGRGWALSVGLIALPYYQDTNPVLAGIARRAIEAAFEMNKTIIKGDN